MSINQYINLLFNIPVKQQNTLKKCTIQPIPIMMLSFISYRIAHRKKRLMKLNEIIAFSTRTGKEPSRIRVLESETPGNKIILWLVSFCHSNVVWITEYIQTAYAEKHDTWQKHFVYFMLRDKSSSPEFHLRRMIMYVWVEGNLYKFLILIGDQLCHGELVN